jgi:hypothetical protein
MIAVFNSRPMTSNQIDPFFRGSLISGLTGEVVAFFDGGFPTAFYSSMAFDGDDRSTEGKACGNR